MRGRLSKRASALKMYHTRPLFCWFPHLTCIDIDARDPTTYLGWYSSCDELYAFGVGLYMMVVLLSQKLGSAE